MLIITLELTCFGKIEKIYFLDILQANQIGIELIIFGMLLLSLNSSTSKTIYINVIFVKTF